MKKDFLKYQRNKLANKKSEEFLKGKAMGVFDDRLIVRQYYNPNKFTVKFVRQNEFISYIKESNIHLGPDIAFLKPDDFLTLPHMFYILTAINNDGSKIDVHFNLLEKFGDAIDDGEKNPSLPVVDTNYQGNR